MTQPEPIEHEDEQDVVTIAELKNMREHELLDFIRDTVAQLNKLGDRLEAYAKERELPAAVVDLSSHDNDEAQSQT